MGTEPGWRDLNINEISLMLKLLKGETSLSAMARELDITLQGVRYYINSMKDRNFLSNMTLTQEGYEYLGESLKLLKKLVIDGTEAIYDSSDWECIADSKVDQNAKVYLKMNGGYLHATAVETLNCATATASESASTGHKVRIRDIRGIIEIDFGSVTVHIIERLNENNYNQCRAAMVKELDSISESDEIFVLGEGVASLLTGRKHNRYSPIESAFDAANRGINSHIYSTSESWVLNSEHFNSMSEKFQNIKTSVSSLKL